MGFQTLKSDCSRNIRLGKKIKTVLKFLDPEMELYVASAKKIEEEKIPHPKIPSLYTYSVSH